MKKIKLRMFLLATFFLSGFCVSAKDRSRLIQNLETGQKQTVVTFGTSLTAIGAWVDQLSTALAQAYPGQATVINGAQGGANSDWGIKSFEDKVLRHHPDTVLIEFSINDAVERRKTSVDHCRSNLASFIDQLQAQNPKCEIILQVMNVPFGQPATQRPNLSAYNQMVREVAKGRGLQLIDHYPNWTRLLNDDPLCFLAYVPDGVHPVRAGALEVITPHLLKELGLTVATQPEKSTATPCWKYLTHIMRNDKKSPDTSKADFNTYWDSLFTRSDLNQDDALNHDELQARALLIALDADKNGSVERAEWRQHFPDLFTAFDKNGDGTLSKAEKAQLGVTGSRSSNAPESLTPYTEAGQGSENANEVR